MMAMTSGHDGFQSGLGCGQRHIIPGLRNEPNPRATAASHRGLRP